MDFIEEWLTHFAGDIPNKFLKKRVFNGGFIWHIFSFNKISQGQYLSGDDARAVFDGIDKSGAKYYLLWDDEAVVKKLKKGMDAKYIDEFEEFYVVASNWSWTYIKTHEDDCGPYFYRKL